MWNCGGGFVGKLAALLASHGDADALVILETQMPTSMVPVVPGYRLWLNSRRQGLGGGIAVLVREGSGLGPAAEWRPDGRPQSPYHMWIRFGGAQCDTPLYLAAAYVPPTTSSYSPSCASLGDWFTRLGDEAAEAMAGHADSSILLAGDLNGHLGALPDWADHNAELEAALPDELAAEVLVPCASRKTGAAPPPRASACQADSNPRGEVVLRFCKSTGMLVANGIVTGDEAGNPTCFSGKRPSLLDVYLANPACLARAESLRVLEAVPEYVIHRPVELRLAGPVARPPSDDAAPAGPEDGSEEEEYGPPPSLLAPLRIDADRLPAFAEALGEAATAEQLTELIETVSSDPLHAVARLHSLLYDTAAEVLGTVRPPGRRRQAHTAGALRRQCNPWFDQLPVTSYKEA